MLTGDIRKCEESFGFWINLYGRFPSGAVPGTNTNRRDNKDCSYSTCALYRALFVYE